MNAVSNNPSLINWSAFQAARAELGVNFVRILGYFREDGVESLDKIEAAMRSLDAKAMVLPAHRLKGESRQFGAEPLADLAEVIEGIARACIERGDTPSQALEHVVRLRPMFNETLVLLEGEANPLVARRPAFGRRAPVLGG